MSDVKAPLDSILAALRAAGEPTRLRLLALLADGELNVTDLTEILGQSQPRISRHLKLLTEAALVERNREGSWAFFRLADRGPMAALARDLTSRITGDDPQVARDRERFAEVRKERAEAAAAYFRTHAHDWNAIRALHVEEQAVEAAVREAIGAAPIHSLLDLGTGTGRMLELLGSDAERVVGLDLSHEMLAVARANLAEAGLARAQLRQGDVYAPPVTANSFDLVVVHQVLHFLEDGARAIREAARALRPGGRLLVVDFAPHDLEFLRDAHAHRRLGFAADVVADWMLAAGLEVTLHRNLPPPDDAPDKLTVSIWLARDPRVITDLPLTDPSRAVA
ncbi:ArsR family transcriptional regulator [Agaricicola taiwanensis]|uniref:ArsR family transcriptional regulator n=1 Tax=Agaricicola taiwanensis TaxID=591372 RepID=A0A8J2VUP2_9RHOB|nr:metalloregulator ArsR/SmtB family transcription factor [Agaricicola taiwanensis]GGE41887.1 ArsR family transcriptional regulator [Agaricicola taiwanensis]